MHGVVLADIDTSISGVEHGLVVVAAVVVIVVGSARFATGVAEVSTIGVVVCCLASDVIVAAVVVMAGGLCLQLCAQVRIVICH